jgi:hypothetical protein
MRGNTARKTALVLWAAFAFVTWNVVFDRHVYVAAVQFTQAQIRSHQRGERVSSIESAFTPQLGHAARQATLWGGAVLVTGLLLIVFVDRRGGSS